MLQLKVAAKMTKKEINKNEIKNKLEICFKKCATERNQLRKCVNNAMNKGFTREDVLAIADEMTAGGLKNEASLCAVTAIGEALHYEEASKKVKPASFTPQEKEKIHNKLMQCFKKCGLARRQLRKCVVNALDAGLTKEEVLAITDDLVGGLGKNEVSVCAIVAVDEALKYEEIDKLKKTIKIYAPYMEFNE